MNVSKFSSKWSKSQPWNTAIFGSLIGVGRKQNFKPPCFHDFHSAADSFFSSRNPVLTNRRKTAALPSNAKINASGMQSTVNVNSSRVPFIENYEGLLVMK